MSDPFNIDLAAMRANARTAKMEVLLGNLKVMRECLDKADELGLSVRLRLEIAAARIFIEHEIAARDRKREIN